MDDNFELDQLDLNDMPPVSPPDDEPVAPPAEAAAPRKPRKKRRKRPTWQRMLWKYWPPIRFGLIILAGILLIWLAFRSVNVIFSGDPTPTEPPAPSETQPPETEPTDPPTEPPTEAPTDPPDPFAGAVPEEWYDNTLFIGDFNTCGLQDNARAGNADYFCSFDMGVFNWDEEVLSDDHFEEQDLKTLLNSKTYEKIIINLGINNCGYPTSSLIDAYSSLIATVRDVQPEAAIILHGIMPVTERYAEGTDYFSSSHIRSVNERIAAMADGKIVYYIDVSESFVDANGYLLSSESYDGCILTSDAYEDFAKLIGVALGKLGIE